MIDQIPLPFDEPFKAADEPALWTPREIWVRFEQRMIPTFREDRRIEYKRTPKIDFDAFARYLSGFSNSPDGGVLCFGVSDTGKITGCKCLSPDQLDRIETAFLNSCPGAKPEFKRVSANRDGESDFLILIYIPYVSRLVETNKGEAFARYGSSLRKMSEEEKRDFRSTRNEISFELEDAPYKFPDDFDEKILRDFCQGFRERDERHSWTDLEILENRRLIRRSGRSIIPLNSLVLLAAKDPGRSVPGCRVRVQRFDGTSEGSGETYNPIRDKFIEGNLVKLIAGASAAISDSLHNVTWLNADGKFVTSPEYPRWAWFEALVNACVHRSYVFSGTDITVKIFRDRMEIESPGGFVPPVSEETIYSMRSSRNLNTMDAMRYLGYVQMAREGTRRIKQSMIDQNLPEPTFTQEVIHGLAVRVTLHNDHRAKKRSSDGDVARALGGEKWKLLQEHEMAIVAYAFRNGSIQVSECQRVTGRTWATSKKDLEKLVRKDVLRFMRGAYPRDPKAHYVIWEDDLQPDK